MTTDTGYTRICYLCGKPIDHDSPTPEESRSMDHVPPKQFFPKNLRSTRNPNLWLAPTHKRCNEDYRKDEEYFYHAMYCLVAKENREMGKHMFADLARRSHKPQTPAMIRNIVRESRNVTAGGIHLPPGLVELSIDQYRSERVIIKISQGLIFLDCHIHMPRENCKDIRLCIDESEVPELYSLAWSVGDSKQVCPDVFSYRRFEFENLHLLSMLFWNSFMFCCAFEASEISSEG